MRPYEVMIIFDAGLEEESIRAVIDRATEPSPPEAAPSSGWTAGAAAASPTRSSIVSRAITSSSRRPQSPAAMAEMDRVLSLADEVVRHKVIRIPDSVAGRGARPAPVTADVDRVAGHGADRTHGSVNPCPATSP